MAFTSIEWTIILQYTRSIKKSQDYIPIFRQKQSALLVYNFISTLLVTFNKYDMCQISQIKMIVNSSCLVKTFLSKKSVCLTQEIRIIYDNFVILLKKKNHFREIVREFHKNCVVCTDFQNVFEFCCFLKKSIFYETHIFSG